MPSFCAFFVLDAVNAVESFYNLAIAIDDEAVVIEKDSDIGILLRLDGGSGKAQGLRRSGKSGAIQYIVSGGHAGWRKEHE